MTRRRGRAAQTLSGSGCVKFSYYAPNSKEQKSRAAAAAGGRELREGRGGEPSRAEPSLRGATAARQGQPPPHIHEIGRAHV